MNEMLAIELRFVAGRYHATPWGRNVNEGVAEWPPSPFRLARALVDAAFRKHPDWSGDRLCAVLEALESPRCFYLPPITMSHIRCFQRLGSQDPSDKAKIFDAFVAVDRAASVVVGFDAEPLVEVRADLDELLRSLPYLGRSESWIEARLLPSGSEHEMGRDLFCVRPLSQDAEPDCETVHLACLRAQSSYEEMPNRPTTGKRGGGPGSPMSWLQAISLSTRKLLESGWSSHPAMIELDFLLPRDALRPRLQRSEWGMAGKFHEVRFSLHSKVLPLLTDALKVSERARSKLMGIHRRIMGGDPRRVSPLFSGKQPDGSPATGHAHAYYLPLDEDGDGRLDHLVIRSNTGFDDLELSALDALRSLWQAGGRSDIILTLESLTRQTGQVQHRRWVSLTPFVTRRHHRKGRGAYETWVESEVIRACSLHGLPEPDKIEPIERTMTTARPQLWLEFTRSRKGEVPLPGHGWILEFAEPVPGPFAIGDLAHFGLGLFVPLDEGYGP